jgi:hypothetical protein
MWLHNVEPLLLEVNSRVYVADASDVSGRFGVVVEEQGYEPKWLVEVQVQGAQPSFRGYFASNQLQHVVLDVHAPLIATNGLWIQPYCASVPIPPSVLNRRGCIAQ